VGATGVGGGSPGLEMPGSVGAGALESTGLVSSVSSRSVHVAKSALAHAKPSGASARRAAESLLVIVELKRHANDMTSRPAGAY
jgi:hypothetical protein